VTTLLPLAVVAAYALLLILVASRARAARHFEEFSLAKRSLPVVLIFASLAATYVGPGFSIGFAGKGFKTGLLFWLVGLAYALQNILVGLFIAPRLRAMQGCHTLGDAVGQKYDRLCHVLAGIISVGLCAGFAAVMAKAGGDVLHGMFALPRWLSITIVAAATAMYTTVGGLRASVITDAFQFTTFAILLPVIFFVIFFARARTDASAFVTELSAATSVGLDSTKMIDLIGLIAAFFLGEMLIPPYANRALASRTTTASRNSFILAGVFSSVWFMVMISLGVSARGLIPPQTPEDQVLMRLVKTVMPLAGHPLLLVALVSVIMSSLDSLLNAGAVAFAQDVVKPFAHISDKAALNIGRCATIAIAAVAAVGALAVQSIISGLLVCYTIWAPAILPALVLGLLIPAPKPLAAILSMAAGIVVACKFEFFSPHTIPTIIVAIAASLGAYVLGHLLAVLSGRLK